MFYCRAHLHVKVQGTCVLQCVAVYSTARHIYMFYCCSVLQCVPHVYMFYCKEHLHILLQGTFTYVSCIHCNTLQLQHTATATHCKLQTRFCCTFTCVSCVFYNFVYCTARHIYIFYCKAHLHVLLQGTVYSTARHMCVAVCCSVFYCKAHVCCSVLQCILLQCTFTCVSCILLCRVFYCK